MNDLLIDSCRVALAGMIHSMADVPVDRFDKRILEALRDASPSVAEGLPEIEGLLSASCEAAERAARGTGKTSADRPSACRRLRSILEEVSLSGGKSTESLRTGFALSPMSAQSLYPKPLREVEGTDQKKATAEYERHCRDFLDAIASDAIPGSFRKNLPLWLDTYDTLLMAYAQSMPSLDADVSLYDQARITTAIAVALWRWHHDEGKTGQEDIDGLRSGADAKKKRLLLIQGDFYGIQNFIFSEGRETNKDSAKLLRGRSFYVSLVCELAALRILQELDLPPTSQIMNAAGKFVIVAPNTKTCRDKLGTVSREIDDWFIRETFATAGIGIAALQIACSDFDMERSQEFSTDCFEALELKKYRQFDLASLADPVMRAQYPNGACRWQGKLPADGKEDGCSCALSRDQIKIGECLTKYSRLMVLSDGADIRESASVRVCELPVFGYRIAFAMGPEESGYFGSLTRTGHLLRCWEFELPRSESDVLWHGFARRNINAYVPRTADGAIMPLTEIATRDSHDGIGLVALMTLKGDVDNLGQIFQSGLKYGKTRHVSFARRAALSRQMNAFFAVALPVLNAKECRNTYTVFAGGDDFFMIGPWLEAQKLAFELQRQFSLFTGQNSDVHFSAGLVLSKPSVPAPALAEFAEEALKTAKDAGKNCVNVFGETVAWAGVPKLQECERFLRECPVSGKKDESKVTQASATFLYSLFGILDLVGDAQTSVTSNIWRSRLHYNAARLCERLKCSSEETESYVTTLLNHIEHLGPAFRIALSNVFYSIRQQ